MGEIKQLLLQVLKVKTCFCKFNVFKDLCRWLIKEVDSSMIYSYLLIYANFTEICFYFFFTTKDCIETYVVKVLGLLFYRFRRI